MLYRHLFDKIFTEFRGILRVFVNFAGFRGFTWISRLRDRAKYQKPCKVENVTSRPVVKWYQGRKCSITVVKWYQGRKCSIRVAEWYQGRKCSITVAKWYQGRKCSITVAKWFQGRKCSITVVKWYQGRKCSITVAKWYQGRTPFAAVLNFFYPGFYTRLRFCSTNNLGFPFKLHTIITLHLTSFRSSIPLVPFLFIYMYVSLITTAYCKLLL